MRIIKSALNSIKSLTRFEKTLWAVSFFVVLFSILLSKNVNPIALAASLIGVSALIFVARGDVLGQIMLIAFSILYAIVSFQMAYYGEVITYLGMSGTIALISTIVWIKHPYKEKQVKVNKPKILTYFILFVLTVLITQAFFYILRALNTPNLVFSTISVATSFFAASLTVLRSPYYAIAYALNDIVLIVLWVLAAIADISSMSMIFCFSMFLFNDIYGFINWKRMEKKQREEK